MKFKRIMLVIIIMMTCSLVITGCTKEKELEITTSQDENQDNYKKEEVTPKEVETGQCYDCGEYYPVSNMTFNGRSYHCGCLQGCCVYCNARIYKEQKANYLNGEMLCDTCYHDNYELNKEWTCENCGRVNVGEVLCDCEFE